MGAKVEKNANFRSAKHKTKVLEAVSRYKKTPLKRRPKLSELAAQCGLQERHLRPFVKPFSRSFKRQKALVKVEESAHDLKRFKSGAQLHSTLPNGSLHSATVRRRRQPFRAEQQALRRQRKRENYVDPRKVTKEEQRRNLASMRYSQRTHHW